MDDSIIERLRAALDQAQTLAENASSPPGSGEWRVAPSGNLVEGPYVLINADTSPGIGSWHFAHFAAWCPARVLRLIASHRALLDRHKPIVDEPVQPAFVGCEVCSYRDPYEELLHVAFPCPDVAGAAAFWLGEDTE